VLIGLDRPLHAEARFNRQTFVYDLNAGHTRSRRPFLTPPEHFRDGFDVSAEQGFDGAVAAVAHPAAETECVGFISHPCAKAHALNAAFDANMHGAER
jgi:hypothetical protein